MAVKWIYRCTKNHIRTGFFVPILIPDSNILTPVSHYLIITEPKKSEIIFSTFFMRIYWFSNIS